MRICYVADVRSPLAVQWIDHFIERGDEVHVVSTHPATWDRPSASFHVVPVGFPFRKPQDPGSAAQTDKGWTDVFTEPLSERTRNVVAFKARFWAMAADVPRHVPQLRRVIDGIRPDLVHAMRLPFEGILAALARPAAPLTISVWGNDFTLVASGVAPVGLLTRIAVRRSSALHADCRRDVELAGRWGFPPQRPATILPTNGGVARDVFHPGACDPPTAEFVGAREGAPVVLNPRGMRNYVRNDVFFAAVPRILERVPDAVFLCPGMDGHPAPRRWLARYGGAGSVRLLPGASRTMMAELFRLATVSVSPTEHDGTPNSLLEAMASGCLPVAGDLPSIREWITPGRNGLVCSPRDPADLAGAIVRGLTDDRFRAVARDENLRLVDDRAEYVAGMEKAERFYEAVVSA